MESSSSSSSPEIFPLVLGGLLLVCNVAFTAFTLWVVFRKRVENQNQAQAREEEGATTGTGEDRKDERFGGMGSKRSSWVFGRIASKRASSAATFAPSLNNIQEDDAAEVIEETMIKEEEAILSWKELSCSYPSKRSGEPNITTLSNVTGHIRYQELVAIMGGSGGGKSTLMDILSGRKTLGNLSGEMSVLGTEMSPSSMDCKNILRDVAAYVPQNEQFFPNQTPEEAVEFAANLKLGRDERGDHVRKSRVREMLDLVGIPVKARTRSIGGTLAGGVVLRGLSGGERKRLALACAFAMKPKLIFLDEITSGLDSENAVVVIDL
jgi:ABC-type lipoprotein export system ATPase subunit